MKTRRPTFWEYVLWGPLAFVENRKLRSALVVVAVVVEIVSAVKAGKALDNGIKVGK